MNKILEKIGKIGIVPVIVLEDKKHALPLAKALYEGGLPCAEVTFRTDAAEESIKIISQEFPEMLVGAGTVLTKDQVDRAVNAGAKFIISPGLNPEIVKYCIEIGVPITPGTANPSDIEAALSLGIDVVKFFPAEAAGGLNMIKSMAAPYTNVKFIPTGGINAKNLNSYLEFPKVLACGGSWMVNSKFVKEERFDEIKNLTKEAIQTMLGFDIKHVGINSSSQEEASEGAKKFADIFGLTTRKTSISSFAGSIIEIMDKPGFGAHGHIGVSTNSVERAVNFLENQGVKFIYETAKYDDNGKMKFIYLEEEILGFATHLIAK